MRLQPLPLDGDPQRLWALCCSGAPTLAEQLYDLASACPVGAAALTMAMLPSLERRYGSQEARQALQLATQLTHGLEQSCQWVYQTNRATWPHIHWFLEPLGASIEPFGCPPGAVRLFVAEADEALFATPLACAERGLCFTEALEMDSS